VKQTRKANLPMQFFATRFMPDSLNEEARTLEVTFSTGAQVKRFDFLEGSFVEELAMGEDNVRLERFNNGAQLLNNHDRSGGVESVLGVVEAARVENGVGIARIRFSDREDVEPIFRDVKNGILRNFSVGYRVHSFEERQEEDKRILRAIDWEPTELSLVTIPADPGAQARNSGNELNACQILMEETEMRQNESAPKVEPKVEPKAEVDVDAIRSEAIKVERDRVAEINDSCRSLGLGDDVAKKFIDEGTAIDQVRKEVISLAAKAQADTHQQTERVEVVRDEKENMTRGMTEAILYRSGAKKDCEEIGQKYANMSVLNMARVALNDRDFSMNPSQIAERAFHSTSDFPKILEDAAKKTLRQAYMEAPSAFDSFTRRVTTNDFKDIKRYQLGEFSGLLEKPEGSEYKGSTVGEGKESYGVKTYGRFISFTREMLINDDLDAFNRIPMLMGDASKRLEADKCFGVLTGNPVMGDGVALFNAAHGNLGSGALSSTSLSAARAAMRKQKGLDDEARLNLTPRYLIVPVALETAAEQLISSISPQASGDVNPFAPQGRTPLELIVEPRLDDSSAVEWYLASDMRGIDMIELATLSGMSEPSMERKDDFDTDGVKWKVRHEIGVAPIDYRGFYKSSGV